MLRNLPIMCYTYAQWAYSQPCVTRIEAEAEETNIASIAVLRAYCFVPSGKLGREGIRFFINAE